jgi:quercetin dioxygenase-like cupin family protein
MRHSDARTLRFLGFTFVTAVGIILAAASGRGSAGTPDPGGGQRVLLENDRVRARLLAYPPGTRGPEHEHGSPRVVVVLEGGRLEVRGAKGEMATLALESGDVVWRPAERHAVANIGKSTIRLVEIDVLDCPPRPADGETPG